MLLLCTIKFERVGWRFRRPLLSGASGPAYTTFDTRLA